MSDLAQLWASYEKEPALQELRIGCKNLVPGMGKIDHPVVAFVGEAPGAAEDKQRKPFIGASGKWLDEHLKAIGLARKDVYITNVIKYRPRHNRDPYFKEIEVSKPYLMSELGIVRPVVVCTFGKFALNVFEPNRRISVMHGRKLSIRIQDDPAPKQYAVLVPLFHPAAVLRGFVSEEVAAKDFQILRQYL